jgi:phage tail sheath protein FI
MIDEAIDVSTQWAVFQPHDEALRLSLTQSISGFLDSLWRKGMLAGATREQAFYVKCDDTVNPPESVARIKAMLHEWDDVVGRSAAEGEGQVAWQSGGPGLGYRD